LFSLILEDDEMCIPLFFLHCVRGCFALIGTSKVCRFQKLCCKLRTNNWYNCSYVFSLMRISIKCFPDYRKGSINFQDLNFTESYDASKAFTQSQLGRQRIVQNLSTDKTKVRNRNFTKHCQLFLTWTSSAAIMLTVRQLSRLWKADHISVNAAYPGVTSTNIKRHMGVDKSISGKGRMLQGSVVDPCHFGKDRDPRPVPRILTTDLRTLLFSTVTFKMPIFFLITFCGYIYISLQK